MKGEPDRVVDALDQANDWIDKNKWKLVGPVLAALALLVAFHAGRLFERLP
jgi:hypothetical protein